MAFRGVNKLTSIFCGFVIITNLLGFLPVRAAGEGTPLKGKVVDATGQPVAGAAVECYKYGNSVLASFDDPELVGRVTTATNGEFELRDASVFSVLLVRKPGFAPAWWNGNAALFSEPQLIMTTPGFLAGMVVDEKDKPVGNAEVFVSAATSEISSDGRSRNSSYLSAKLARTCFSTRSGADGRFRISNFPTNGTAELIVFSPGKALRAANEEPVTLRSMSYNAGQDDIRLILDPAGTVEGKIMTEEGAQTLPAAKLTLYASGNNYYPQNWPASSVSAADGTFRFNDVGAGSYKLRAVFGTNNPPEWVAENTSVSVEVGQTTRDVQVKAVKGGFLEVLVRNQENRQPMNKMSINAINQSSSSSAVTDSNGIALLRLVPGQYSTYALKDKWRSENTQVNVEARQTNRLEVEMIPPLKISGVVHQPNGQLAAGVMVRIMEGFLSGKTQTKTDTNGRFVLEWEPKRFGQMEITPCLLVQDGEKNLAVAQDIDESSGPVELKLEEGLTIVGRVESEGKPVANVNASLIFWSGRTGMSLPGLGRSTNSPGHFEIVALPKGRKYGLSVTAPGYGTKRIDSFDSAAARVELDTVELRPANKKLAGKVVDADDKPVAGVYVNVQGDNQPMSNARTDRDGQFIFPQVCEGAVRITASARNTYGSTSAEGGDTNVVLRLGESAGNIYSVNVKPWKLKGIVTGPDNQPVAGIAIATFPNSGSRNIKTSTNGEFNFTWTPQSFQAKNASVCLIARDMGRSLAATETLTEASSNIVLRLQPGIMVSGRILGTNNTPLPKAEVGMWVKVDSSLSTIDEQTKPADDQGTFKFPALPAGLNYTLYAKAKGYGQSRQAIELEAGKTQVELPPITLKLADKIVSGQVVDGNEKPVSGAYLHISGTDQPSESVTTDSKGRFTIKVCDGEISISANNSSGYGSKKVNAGDTNVVVTLSRSFSSTTRSVPKRPTLKGQPLPALTDFGFAADSIPPGRPVLLCLFDHEQRPSRRSLRLLAEQYDSLQKKGITVLAIQAAQSTAEALKAWKDTGLVPFPVGQVSDKAAKTKWVSQAGALPCLILADQKGQVIAEGFPFEELEAKLKMLNK